MLNRKDLNKNQERRDSIIFTNNTEYYDYTTSSGTRYFDTLTLSQLKQLVEEDFIELDIAQNCAPTVGEILGWATDIVQQFPHLEQYICFIGYTVGIQRHDYRVSLEGVTLNQAGKDLPYEVVESFVTNFRQADSFQIDEKLYCWYD